MCLTDPIQPSTTSNRPEARRLRSRAGLLGVSPGAAPRLVRTPWGTDGDLQETVTESALPLDPLGHFKGLPRVSLRSVDGTSLTSRGPARDLGEFWPSAGLPRPGMRHGAVQEEPRCSPLEDQRGTCFEPAAVVGPPRVPLWASCGPQSGFARTSAPQCGRFCRAAVGRSSFPSGHGSCSCGSSTPAAALYVPMAKPDPWGPLRAKRGGEVRWEPKSAGSPKGDGPGNVSGRRPGRASARVIRQTFQTGPPVCHWGVRVGR